MAGFLIFLGLVGIVVAVIMLAARAVFKKGWPYKKAGILAGIAVIVLIIGSALAGPSVQKGYEAGKQAAQNPPAQTQNTQPVKNSTPAQTNSNAPQQQDQKEEKLPANVTLEKNPAQDAKELAQMIVEVIKATGGVEECNVIGAEEEVSTGGYWLSAEVKVKGAKDAWQIARNGVLTAYLNKGQVPLAKVSVNIMAPPEDKMYALQVSAGSNHFDGETLKFLKNGTWIDFQQWIKENQTRGGYKQYAEDLWAQGPLAF